MENDPLWYKDAIIYELHVRAFYDSDADGIGDFLGLASKLDYLQDLGITAIWLLPFYPSALKDDGYDIADHFNIHPSYGTLSDFKFLVKEAHLRGLRVITEMVLNHTSDAHPWFRRAERASSKSRARDFYVWSDTAEKYPDARIIFKDFETSNWAWSKMAQAYYWHRFYFHQPDLNFDNPHVRTAMLKVMNFWLGLGVDGMRLDAVPYLYERDQTHCENLPETHAFLKELRRFLDQKHFNRMLLAEANQWPEEAAAYFGSGNECHMAFHFPLMPRLFMALHIEDRFPIIDIIQQTPAIPDSCQWALFLRNHDELTLEMVTDEERDYMYRVYAHDPMARINLGIRRRLAPLLGNHRRKIELMNGLLFSLPGTPVIYYGDELGMGDNIFLGDRNGVRTPMQWNADRNAGFSKANPQRLFLPIIIDPEYHYETINVEAQQGNVHSLLWWMKRLINIRKQSKALSRGRIEFLSPENHKVLVFIRQYENERILILANLSRFIQYVELDLSAYQGMRPIEIFGRVEFPPIGTLPYFMTIASHSFYWFTLEPIAPPVKTAPLTPTVLAELEVRDDWSNIFEKPAKTRLEREMILYLKQQRWFAGKAYKIRSTEITETIEIPYNGKRTYVCLLQVEYMDRIPEKYILPLTFVALAPETSKMQEQSPTGIMRLLVRRREETLEGILYDASLEKNFMTTLLTNIRQHRRFKGGKGEIRCSSTPYLKELMSNAASPLEPSLMRGEQSNTSIVFADRLILKLFRNFQEGINPDLEISRYLSEKQFAHTPVVVGALEYISGRQEPSTLGLFHQFIPNQGSAWQYTLDALSRYFEQVLTKQARLETTALFQKSPLKLSQETVEPQAAELINPYLETARLLGQRTAELHVTLSQALEESAFSPEPFTPFYQRSFYQALRNLTGQMFRLLSKHLKNLPQDTQTQGERVLSQRENILKRFHKLVETRISAVRIRCHGDFHLGQVLHTGKDFVIIDFEGEPARTFQDRKSKRSPLKDVAGMLRSFHYASYTCLANHPVGFARAEDIPLLEPWAYYWYLWVSSSYLKSYIDTAHNAVFLPRNMEEISLVLDIYLLEKAIYELIYEMNHRPKWIHIPLRGIIQILEQIN